MEGVKIGDKELQDTVELESQLDLNDAFRDLYRLLDVKGAGLTETQKRAFAKGAQAILTMILSSMPSKGGAVSFEDFKKAQTNIAEKFQLSESEFYYLLRGIIAVTQARINFLNERK